MLLNVGDYMVPDLFAYGDLTNVDGLPGQHTARPSEKVFDSHFVVKVGAAAGGQGPSFDPSYGVTYVNAADFEVKAVAGYLLRFTGEPVGEYHVRQPNGTTNVALVP
jgi:hypothetical protein